MLDHASTRTRIGIITHGSLGSGLEMKLHASEAVEHVKAGRFVVVEGDRHDFFAMITDIRIDAANENILLNPPAPEEELLRLVLQGTGTYATVSLKPMLMMPNTRHPEFAQAAAQPVKTVPAHFSLVAEADEEDVARIFGAEANEDGTRWFEVGQPLDMEEIPVCLDLAAFVERSNAVFGKTGTGKSFLTRLLLSGLIKTGRAVNLVFDMHGEYGMKALTEGAEQSVRGLKSLFPERVLIFSLDPATTRRRGSSADEEVYIYADQIEPDDILPLQDTLRLNPTAAESTYLLRQKLGKNWLGRLLQAEGDEINELAAECGANEQSVSALYRKLSRLKGLGFFKTESVRQRHDVLDALLEAIDAGKSVVFEFGEHKSLLVYLLVANVITRRLRDRYEDRVNQYLASQKEADKPQQLVITIEEAHKFLGPGVARETPFGKIAREMRKFFVSLLVVDQRPSGIDEEVLSQIGTKVVAQLNDDKDISAALVGTRDSSALRQVLAALDSKQQALLLGHAVPMPIVVKTRTYGPEFYKAMQADRPGAGQTATDMRDTMHELF